jgi:hypothetical protein
MFITCCSALELLNPHSSRRLQSLLDGIPDLRDFKTIDLFEELA